MNLALFLLVGGFVWYMVSGLNRPEISYAGEDLTADEPFVSPWQETGSLEVPEEINRFELAEESLYISAGTTVYRYGMDGELQHRFASEEGVRDIALCNGSVYLLYPTRIEVYTPQGELVH
ncbi:MAG: hypothetical protein LUD15_05030 [Bacteroides sp.]|nr:hypothetical protein [Bacteroides sp.]